MIKWNKVLAMCFSLSMRTHSKLSFFRFPIKFSCMGNNRTGCLVKTHIIPIRFLKNADTRETYRDEFETTQKFK